MQKPWSWIVGAVILIVVLGGGYAWFRTRTSVSPMDYRNGTYSIMGRNVILKDGFAETPIAPGSATKLTTRYFGNEATGDLNGDGLPDAAFLLTQDGGGSGTFYYVVAAIRTKEGFSATSAELLGDRIAPQTTEIRNGELIVNYATRKAEESMSAQPSVGVSKRFHVDNGRLITNL